MYNQNNVAMGVKWFFFLAILILIGAVALGADLKSTKWRNREITSATANQMNYATEAEQRKSESTDLADAIKAEYCRGFYIVLNNGLMILLVAIGIVLTVAVVNASLRFRTIKIKNAAAFQANKVPAPDSAVTHRQPSQAAKQARLREHADRRMKIQAERVDQILKNTEVIWSAEEKKSE